MAQLPGNKGTAGTKSNQDTTGAPITTTPTPAYAVMVQNDPDNTVELLVGFADAQTVQLSPGDAITLSIDDASKIYTKSVSGTANVNYLTLTTGP